MKRILIIPARGGSKRIPGKNLKFFAGYPIIKYTIEAALQCSCFDEVMVSTDDEKIAETAKKYGASVPFLRSVKNSDDYSTTVDVLLEVLEKYNEKGKQFDTLCCIYPTAPFITSDKIANAISEFEIAGADALVSIVKYGFPILRSFSLSEKKIKFNFPENEKTRSQDLAPAYHDAAQFYLIKTNVLLSKKTFITENTIGFELSEMECQDIDTETDWKMAELKFELIRGKD